MGTVCRSLSRKCYLPEPMVWHTLAAGGQTDGIDPMDKIYAVAVTCVGRAVMFGTLAIGLVMLSFSFDLARALMAGAFLTLVMAQILILKAQTTSRQKPGRTETWNCLAPEARPAGRHGRKIFLSILADVYMHFATLSFAAGCSLFAAAMGVRLARALI
ncbi:hypothetical protein SAMN05216176_102487 [Nitratireductor indicus]|nr:hypothetical protein SAMN05216176_102487 [Nitratireductor indicus]